MGNKKKIVRNIIILILIIGFVGIILMVNENSNMNIGQDVLFSEYTIIDGKIESGKTVCISNKKRTEKNDIVLTQQSYIGDGKYIGYYYNFSEQSEFEGKKAVAIYDYNSDDVDILFETDYESNEQTIFTINNNSKVVYAENKSGLYEYDINTKKKTFIVGEDITKGHRVFISEDGKDLYYRSKESLMKMDISTKETIKIADSVQDFILSTDNEYVVCKSRNGENTNIVLINLKDNESRNICTLKEKSIELIGLSYDNSQLLYRTTKEICLPVSGVNKTVINVYDLGENKKSIIYKSNYLDSIRNICWGI